MPCDINILGQQDGSVCCCLLGPAWQKHSLTQASVLKKAKEKQACRSLHMLLKVAHVACLLTFHRPKHKIKPAKSQDQAWQTYGKEGDFFLLIIFAHVGNTGVYQKDQRVFWVGRRKALICWILTCNLTENSRYLARKSTEDFEEAHHEETKAKIRPKLHSRARRFKERAGSVTMVL